MLLEKDNGAVGESSSLLWPERNDERSEGRAANKLGRAGLYAVQVFYSFFIM